MPEGASSYSTHTHTHAHTYTRTCQRTTLLIHVTFIPRYMARILLLKVDKPGSNLRASLIVIWATRSIGHQTYILECFRTAAGWICVTGTLYQTIPIFWGGTFYLCIVLYWFLPILWLAIDIPTGGAYRTPSSFRKQRQSGHEYRAWTLWYWSLVSEG